MKSSYHRKEKNSMFALFSEEKQWMAFMNIL